MGGGLLHSNYLTQGSSLTSVIHHHLCDEQQAVGPTPPPLPSPLPSIRRRHAGTQPYKPTSTLSPSEPACSTQRAPISALGVAEEQ